MERSRRLERFAGLFGRIIGLALALLLVVIAVLGWRSTDVATRSRAEVTRSYEVIVALERLIAAVTDVETGQRGLVITGEPQYLEPYRSGLGRAGALLDQLASRLAQQPTQLRQLATIRPVIDQKLAEVAAVVMLEQSGRHDEAVQRVRTGIGKLLMDQIRTTVRDMEIAEAGLLAERTKAADREDRVTLIATALTALLASVVVLASALFLVLAFRSLRAAEHEAEANADQLKISLDSLSQGVSVFDAGHCLLAWNRCFVELFAVPHRLQHRGAPYAAFVRHDWADEEGDFLETPEQIAIAPLEAAGHLTPVVYERHRTDGRTFELRRTHLPAGGFVITYTDITHRLRTEFQLRQAQRMEAVGQLTGGVAHDFNNLLTVVVGNLDLLRRRIDDPAMAARIEAALKGAERGANLTRQLLAFARRQPLEPQTVDLNRLVADVTGLLRRSLGEAVTVEAVAAAGVWPVLADPAQVENALINLAVNARDAMPEGGRLTIEVANTVLDEGYAREHAEVRPGGYVVLAVTDTGAGMPQEVAARVFEPFFTTKPDGHGTGLGLSQVHGFVKQSGGHISLYSELGVGTTVKIYLPRTHGMAIQTVQAPMEVPRGSETVLVVEDDEAVRETAIAMLRDLGYRTSAARNGVEVLAMLAEGQSVPDILFTDVVLPGSPRGRELAARAQALRPGLRILYTSGYTQNGIVHGGRIDDDVAFLGKPYKKDELARKLRQVMDAAAPRPTAAGSCTILVVEDEALVRLFAASLLTELGHSAIGVANGEEALAVLGRQDTRLDGLLTDLSLPDMRGDQLALRAREQRPELAVILASGFGEIELAADVASLERACFMRKPYESRDLAGALQRVGIRSRPTGAG